MVLYRPFAVADFQYKGQPSPVDVSLALANAGTLQIELIQQRNDAPSLYLDFLRAGHEGYNTLAMGPGISMRTLHGCSRWAIASVMRGVSGAAVALSMC